MPNFQIVSAAATFPQGQEWGTSSKFNSRHRVVDYWGRNLVDHDGKKVETFHAGECYRLVEKRERAYTSMERIVRVAFGCLAVMPTLFLALLSKSVRQLFTAKKLKVRYAVKTTFSQENEISKRELAQGIRPLSDDKLEKLRFHLRNLSPNVAGIKFYESRNSHIFSLRCRPDLVFKAKPKGTGNLERYERGIRCQTVNRTQNFSQLIAPPQLFLEVDGYEVIIEKKLRFDENQRGYFQRHDPTLDLAVSQLAHFICITNYTDVEYRNNPVLIKTDSKGNKQFGLPDLEETYGAVWYCTTKTGLFGGSRTGLYNLVHTEQQQLVQQAAKERRII